MTFFQKLPPRFVPERRRGMAILFSYLQSAHSADGYQLIFLQGEVLLGRCPAPRRNRLALLTLTSKLT